LLRNQLWNRPKKKVRTGLGLNLEPKAFTKVRLAEFRTVDQENLMQPENQHVLIFENIPLTQNQRIFHYRRKIKIKIKTFNLIY
jgi:hypothetical protein